MVWDFTRPADRGGRDINGEIAGALPSMPVADQNAIDRTLIELDGTPNKARLGGNATIAVSMAALHAAAAACGEPLWRNLAVGAEVALPMSMIQIFGGGAHASRRVDVQDFLIMPIGAASFDEAPVMAARVYRAAMDARMILHARSRQTATRMDKAVDPAALGAHATRC